MIFVVLEQTDTLYVDLYTIVTKSYKRQQYCAMFNLMIINENIMARFKIVMIKHISMFFYKAHNVDFILIYVNLQKK